MTNRLIVLWGTESGVGCQTLAKALATRLADDKRTVLVVKLDPTAEAKDPAVWVPQFKALSPFLLQNYLRSPNDRYSTLGLGAAPAVGISKKMFELLRQAFDWIFWLSPVDWSPETLSVLDHADLLLWIARPGDPSQVQLKDYFERLASLHYPNAFSQIILNQIPVNDFQNDVLPEIYHGKRVLLRIPHETPRGIAFGEGIQRLLDILQTRDELYLSNKPNHSTTGTKHTDDVVEDIKSRITPQLLQALDQKEPIAEATQKTLGACLAEDATLAASREERQEIYSRVLNEVLGLGPLEILLQDPAISEVMVNGTHSIYIEKKGTLEATAVHIPSEAQLRTIIDRIIAPIGRRVDESMPLCDARLADGSRVNIVLPPLALDGPTITIRKFMSKALSLLDLIQCDSLNQEMAEFLKCCVLSRKNIVVAGGTGSGKTTLLNALSGLIPDEERVVTIEDAAELRLQKPHVVRLESRPPNTEGEGAIPIRRLVMNALRMRPDRIVVGECRGGEALDMLQAMNTGHDGSLTTIHANSPRDTLRRLETLVLMAGIELPVRVVREQIQSAVDILVQQARLSDGSRKIISITEVTGLEGDTLTIQELFRFRSSGKDPEGRILGSFEKTGLIPTFFQSKP